MSVMPCRLNGDVHEWFNVVVTVPSWNLLNTPRGEKATDTQWEAETLWNFTAACCCDFIWDAQNKQERRSCHFGGNGAIV